MKYYFISLTLFIYSCDGINNSPIGKTTSDGAEAIASEYCNCYRFLDDNSSNSVEKFTRCQQTAEDKIKNMSPDEIQQFYKSLEICNAQFIDKQTQKQKKELEELQKLMR